MTTASPHALAQAGLLLRDFSLEMTGKDAPKLESASQLVPAHTRVNVTYLAGEDLAMRQAAARSAAGLGFTPVPHISARRLNDEQELDTFLAALKADGTQKNVFIVGGDPATAHGPYNDSFDVITSGLLQHHGIEHVGIAGYPEGHPQIAESVLWSALEKKTEALAHSGLDTDIITQFGFDPDPVLTWLKQLRQRAIDVPVRIGVPGPAGVRRLLSFATRFGVGTTTSIARKYGLSLTNLMGTAGPDRFIHALARGYDPAVHGQVKLHFYTFGGLAATSAWIDEFRTKEGLK
ncbi:methylenetetrahydrofolate reductase [Streptomyces olivaceus]